MSTTKGLVEQSIDREQVLNNYFSNEKIDYLYKAKINIYNKNFGGILIIKKIRKEHHRIVFTTETGNKIFDFEIINDDFKVNYIVNELNKKSILNTLQNDFRILVKQYLDVDKQFDSGIETIYQTNYDKNNNLYYFFLKENQKLFKIVKSTSIKEKVIFNFLEFNNNIVTKIDILHQNFKLKIHLRYIGN
ncbi:MAG: hypothetical protein GQ552_03120 [Flavobacteriaceae bacterium]|nr:hypothetical protein [Flavobacteriaceae bacterium]